MVTHEPDAAAWADTVLFLRDGRVIAQLTDPDRDTVLDALRELGDGAAEQAEDGPSASPDGGVGARGDDAPARAAGPQSVEA